MEILYQRQNQQVIKGMTPSLEIDSPASQEYPLIMTCDLQAQVLFLSGCAGIADLHWVRSLMCCSDVWIRLKVVTS